MMPLGLAPIDNENVIKKVGGNAETKKHVGNLGFVPGTVVKIVSEMNGNVIVNVKESRVAVSKELAMKIMV